MFLVGLMAARPYEWTFVFPPKGWTWPNVITAVLSVVALLLSIATFRQRVLYNPQPRIDLMWPTKIETSGGVPYLVVRMFNNGDAAARDVHFTSNTMTTDSRIETSITVLEPGRDINLTVPIVMNTRTESRIGISLEAPKEHWNVVRPVVTVTWRHPPFKRKNPTKVKRRSPEISGMQAYRDLQAPKK